MLQIIKRKVKRNIWLIKLTFMKQRLSRWHNPSQGFHLDKIDKILAAKTFFGIDFLIETGTYLGTTTSYLSNSFSRIVSIELSPDLAREAKEHFKQKKNISIFQGDSGLLLVDIIKDEVSKKVFWLDAHYSAGVTAISERFGDTPISTEIEEILRYWIQGSVVLIDDARLFDGTNNYPTIESLVSFVREKNQELNVFVDKDIIHIY